MSFTVTPNHVTYGRMAAVPLIALMLAIDGKVFVTLALILYIMAAISDWFDGYLARKTETTSLLGRVFDSIADKLLVAGCLLGLAYNGRLGSGLLVPALAILLREIFVAGLREYIFQRRSMQILDGDEEEDNSKDRLVKKDLLASSSLAKIKTVVQMAAIGMLIPAPYLMHPYLGMFGGLCFWVAAALSLYTGWEYWKEAHPVIKLAEAKPE